MLVEAIMPISDREPVRRNIDRAVMALQSYNYFWRGSSPLKVHIVVPTVEWTRLSEVLAPIVKMSRRLAVSIIPEAELSPVFDDFGGGRGYQKQMLVKLAAFILVEAPFCITFDTDVVAFRSFHEGDLVVDGRAVNDWEVPTTTVWYLRALDVLGLNLSLDKLRFFVTPQVLSTAVLRALSEFLFKRFSGQDWMYGLMRAKTEHGIWSEYAVYDLFAEHSGMLSKFHLPPGKNRLQTVEEGIWYAADFARWAPERAFAGEIGGIFMVLQSITAHDIAFDTVRCQWLKAANSIHPGYPE